MKINFNRKNLNEEAVNYIKKKINDLGEIYFQFSPDDLILGFLNFRYNGNLRNRQAKKGINRKVILDKWLAKKLKKGNFYVLRNINLFFFNNYIIFASGDIDDLTDQVESSEVKKERSLVWGLSACLVTKFRHPMQEEKRDCFSYPDSRITWSQDDIVWVEWREQTLKKIDKETQGINKEFLYCKPGDNFYCKLLSMETVDEKIVSISMDIKKSTVTLKPVLKMKYLKKNFPFGSEPKEEIIEETAVGGWRFGRIDFQAVVDAQKTREISISLEKIKETVSDTKQERVRYTRSIGGNDGYRKGLTVSGTEMVDYKIKTIIYLVKGLPDSCTQNHLPSDDFEIILFQKSYAFKTETIIISQNKKGEVFLIYEIKQK